MTIDTSLSGCTAPSSFGLNVAAFDPSDPAKTPLPVNATLNWGDGTSAPLVTGANSHAYKAGKYTLTIDGTLGGFNAFTGSSPACVSSIDHLGENSGIVTLSNFLSNTPNLTAVAPPPTSLQNANSLFSASSFNGDTSGWVLPNLRTALGMFSSATKFNGDLSNLNPKNLVDAGTMFLRAYAFTGKGVDKWRTPKLADANSMFSAAPLFNGDLSNWDVSSVTNFNGMFLGATAFNSDLSLWNVSSGKDFRNTFYNAPKFNSSLANWNVGNGTNFVQMFSGATVFNQDISKWNTAKATNMQGMFNGATAFKQDISKWNVAGVTTYSTFYHLSGLSSNTAFVPAKFVAGGS